MKKTSQGFTAHILTHYKESICIQHNKEIIKNSFRLSSVANSYPELNHFYSIRKGDHSSLHKTTFYAYSITFSFSDLEICI